MNQSAVAASPDFRRTQRRRRDGVDHSIAALPRVFHGHRTFELFLRRFALVAGQIGADSLPVKPAVDSLHYVLRPEKQRAGLRLREDEYRSPGIAILALRDLLAKSGHGPRCDLLALAGAAVEAAHRAVCS